MNGRPQSRPFKDDQSKNFDIHCQVSLQATEEATFSVSLIIISIIIIIINIIITTTTTTSTKLQSENIHHSG